MQYAIREDGSENFDPIDPSALELLRLTAPFSAMNAILFNERARRSILKLYNRKENRFAISDNELTTGMRMAAERSLPTLKIDARKIARVFSVMEKDKDVDILNYVLKSFQGIKTLFDGTKIYSDGLSVPFDSHRLTLDELLNDSEHTAVSDIGTVVQMMNKDLPQFSLESTDSENTKRAAAAFGSYFGFVTYLDFYANAFNYVIMSGPEEGMEAMITYPHNTSQYEMNIALKAEAPDLWEVLGKKRIIDFPHTERTFQIKNKQPYSTMYLIDDQAHPMGRYFERWLEGELQDLGGINLNQLNETLMTADLQNSAQMSVDLLRRSISAENYLNEDQSNDIQEIAYQVSILLRMLDKEMAYADKLAVNDRDVIARDQQKQITKIKEDLLDANLDKKSLQSQVDNLKEKLKNSNAVIAQFERTKKDLADAKQEIEFLKLSNTAKSEDDDIDEAVDQSPDLDGVLSQFNTKKTVFLGGDPKWIQTMQSSFDQAKFFDTDKLSCSLTPVKNADIVVMNVATMNHSMYGRGIKALKKGTELYYINTQASSLKHTLLVLANATNKN